MLALNWRRETEMVHIAEIWKNGREGRGGGRPNRGRDGREAQGQHQSPFEGAAARRGWGAGPTRALRAEPAAAPSRAAGEAGLPPSSVADPKQGVGVGATESERKVSPRVWNPEAWPLLSGGRKEQGQRPLGQQANLGHRLNSWGAGRGWDSTRWRSVRADG